MKSDKIILVVNGASSSEQAPNFISVVTKKQTYELTCEKRSSERGAPERFPLYFQEFIQEGKLVANKIDLIVTVIGPGSFTGLRASIAFALGLKTGLDCPVVSLRRGEAVFPFLEKNTSKPLIWHVTSARRNRVFVESNQSPEIKAYDLSDIPWPNDPVLLSGEAVSMIVPIIPPTVSWIEAPIKEADSLMLADLAEHYEQNHTVTNPLYPLYIDPPKASLPKGGLRQVPE